MFFEVVYNLETMLCQISGNTLPLKSSPEVFSIVFLNGEVRISLPNFVPTFQMNRFWFDTVAVSVSLALHWLCMALLAQGIPIV